MAGTKYPLNLTVKVVDQATTSLQRIAAQINAFNQPFKNLGKAVTGVTEAAGLPALVSGFKGVGSSVGKVASEAFSLTAKFAALGIGGVVAIGSIIRSTVDVGDKLNEMAKRVGLSVDAYAQLQFAAAQADVEQDQFNDSMDTFNKQLGQAKAGTGKLLAFLKKSGPGFAEQIKSVKSAEEGLTLMTKALTAIEDPQRRAALAGAAFGQGNLQMGQFLGQGTGEIEKQRAAFFRLNGSQVAFATASDNADNAIRETTTAFTGLRNVAAAGLLPAVTKLSQALTEFIVKNRDGIQKWAEGAGKAISAWVDSGGIDRLVVGIKSVAESVGKMIDKLGGVEGVCKLAAGAMTFKLDVAVLGLGVNIAKLTWAVGKFLLVTGTLAVTAIGEFFTALGLGFTVIESISLAFGGVAATAAGALVAMAPFVLAAAGLAAAGYEIYKNWEPLKELFSDVWFNAKQVGKALTGQRPEQLRNIVGEYDPVQSAYRGLPASSMRAASAAPVRPVAGDGGQSKVIVEFPNMPKGARVSQDTKGGGPQIDLSMGFGMVSLP